MRSMQIKMSFMTIEEARLDIEYVFFYKRKIGRLNRTLWNDIHLNAINLVGVYCFQSG
jgi:hypothetical protein